MVDHPQSITADQGIILDSYDPMYRLCRDRSVEAIHIWGESPIIYRANSRFGTRPQYGPELL